MMSKKKRIAIFYYEGFAEFEIALSVLLLEKCEIVYVALEEKPYKGIGNQTFMVDKKIYDLDPLGIDMLIVPGGDSSHMYEDKKLKAYFKMMIDNDKFIAGICGGSELLAGMGLLEGVKCTGNTSGVKDRDEVYPYYESAVLLDDQVVVDGQIITAQGQAYAEFAVVLAKYMEVLSDDVEVAETLNWLKNKRGRINQVSHLEPMAGWLDLSESLKVSTSEFEECNMTLIVSDGEAMVVDTGLELPEAERFLSYIKTHKLKLKHVVITHNHPDHVANLSLFRELTDSVISPGNPSKGSMWIGEKEVKVIQTPGHHIDGDISVLVCDEKVLIVGDVIYSCLPPQLCYGSNPQVLTRTIEQLSEMDLNWIVPGHGKVMVADEIIRMSLSYISKLNKEIKRSIALNETLEVVAKIELADCIEHFDWMVLEPSLDLHRQNIEDLFEATTLHH